MSFVFGRAPRHLRKYIHQIQVVPGLQSRQAITVRRCWCKVNRHQLIINIHQCICRLVDFVNFGQHAPVCVPQNLKKG
jgi:hypothetical protein